MRARAVALTPRVLVPSAIVAWAVFAEACAHREARSQGGPEPPRPAKELEQDVQPEPIAAEASADAAPPHPEVTANDAPSTPPPDATTVVPECVSDNECVVYQNRCPCSCPLIVTRATAAKLLRQEKA